MTTAEIVTPAEAINLLSSMYLCKPSPAAVKNWKGALAGDTTIFLADLKKAINDIDLTSEEVREDLLWEYTRLFIGPYKLPCPPWESVYTSPKRLLMQDAAGSVVKLYREAGLTLETAGVMPDHIGVELNFLAILLQRMQSDKNENDGYLKVTQALLDDHLLLWMPEFTRDMEDAAESSLYKALARATRDVLDQVRRQRNEYDDGSKQASRI